MQAKCVTLFHLKYWYQSVLHANQPPTNRLFRFQCLIYVGHRRLKQCRYLKIPNPPQTDYLTQHPIRFEQQHGKRFAVRLITNHSHHPSYRLRQSHHGASYNLNYELKFVRDDDSLALACGQSNQNRNYPEIHQADRGQNGQSAACAWLYLKKRGLMNNTL